MTETRKWTADFVVNAEKYLAEKLNLKRESVKISWDALITTLEIIAEDKSAVVDGLAKIRPYYDVWQRLQPGGGLGKFFAAVETDNGITVTTDKGFAEYLNCRAASRG